MKLAHTMASGMAEVMSCCAANCAAKPEEAEEAKELGNRCFCAFLRYLKVSTASASGEAEMQAAECEQAAQAAYTWLGNFMAL